MCYLPFLLGVSSVKVVVFYIWLSIVTVSYRFVLLISPFVRLRMGRYYCCVPGCSNYKGRIGKFDKAVSLHRIPSNTSLRRAWIIAISRKDWKPTSYSRVCSDHFAGGMGPSKENQIPTILPHKSKKPSTPRREIIRSFGSDVPSISDSNSMETQTSNYSEYSISSSYTDTQSMHWMHTYAHNELEKPSSELQAVHQNCNVKSTGIQATVTTREIGVQCNRPILLIEDIEQSDSDVSFYTGLPNGGSFHALFDTLVDCGADKLRTGRVSLTHTTQHISDRLTPGRQKTLRLVDEFLMVLMRLRLGLLLCDLADRFSISTSQVSRIFTTCTCIETNCFLPKLSILQNNVPKCFKNFADTRIILDCTALFVEKPSYLISQS